MSLQIDNASSSNMTNLVGNYEIDSMNVDKEGGEDETRYSFPDAARQWGVFNRAPDLKSAIILKALWVVGRGYDSPDSNVMFTLDNIYGWGKDSFDDILFHMEVVKMVQGDSFCEIIRNSDGRIINLKQLDTAVMTIVVGSDGLLKRYEQRTSNGKAIKFKPSEILHFSNRRISGQIHGISEIDCLEKTILSEEESHDDTKQVMHNQARPRIIFKLKTNDTTKISAFVTKMDLALSKGENVYIPDDENILTYEVIQANPSSLIMEWRNDIRKKFFRSIMLPELIPSGGGDSTESGGKIGYLTFQQLVEHAQRVVEKQLWNQLQLKINLVAPESILPDLVQDANKDGAMSQMTMQPSDMNAGAGR